MGVMAHPMRTPASGVRSVVDVTTNSHGLQKSCGEKGQHVHSLSERALTVPGQAFIAFWEYCIKEGLHSSLSDSNDQTVDNIPRTMRAYSESGSIS